MKSFINILMSLVISFYGLTTWSATGDHSGGHSNHNVRHDFIMYGTNPIYASHLIYKSPHNFQVILELNLEQEILAKISDLKLRSSNLTFYFEAHNLNFNEFLSSNTLTGSIVYEDETGSRHNILENTVISKDNFKVIYFYELPLDLSKK